MCTYVHLLLNIILYLQVRTFELFLVIVADLSQRLFKRIVTRGNFLLKVVSFAKPQLVLTRNIYIYILTLVDVAGAL